MSSSLDRGYIPDMPKRFYTLGFVKTHEDAILPAKNHNSDTGLDVYSVENKLVPARSAVEIDIGLEFAQIPTGCWISIEGRSGMAFKYKVRPHRGIIDNSYRGKAGILLRNESDEDYWVSKGDRIAQFVMHKNLNVVTELFDKKEETERGSKGFGSSGK